LATKEEDHSLKRNTEPLKETSKDQERIKEISEESLVIHDSTSSSNAEVAYEKSLQTPQITSQDIKQEEEQTKDNQQEMSDPEITETTIYPNQQNKFPQWRTQKRRKRRNRR